MRAKTPACGLALALAVSLLSCGTPESAKEDRGRLPEPPGKTPPISIAPGGRHLYSRHLPAGTFVQLGVDQLGADVIVRFEGPTDRTLIRADSRFGGRRSERVVTVTRRAGRHGLVVESIGRTVGEYAVRVDTLRPATHQDHQLARAAEAMSEAQWLHLEGGETNQRQAVVLYLQALEGFRSLGDHRLEAAQAEAGLGAALSALGTWKQAAGRLREGADGLATAGADEDAAWALIDLGNALRRAGRSTGAEAALQAARAVFRQLHLATAEAVVLNDLGKVYQSRGDLDSAVESYEASLAVREAAGLEAGIAPLLNLGVAYGEIGQSEAATDLLRQALALAERRRDLAAQADSLLALGWFHALDVDPEEALPYLERAAALNDKLDDPLREMALLDRWATVLASAGRLEAAEEGYRRALAVAVARDDETSRRSILINLAGLALQRKDLETARGWLARASSIDGPGSNPGSEVAELMARAELERLSCRLQAAWLHLQAAIERLERSRASLSRSRARALFGSVRRQVYDAAVRVAMELHDREGGDWHLRALEISERSRARGLAEALTRAAAAGSRAPAAERELLHAISGAEEEWLRAGLPEREEGREQAALELARLWRQLERVRAEQAPAPEAPPPLSAHGIAALVEPGVRLVVYHLADDESFVWIVGSAGNIDSRRLPGRDRIERLARDLAVQQRAARQAGSAAQAELLAEELAALVLAPLDPIDGETLAIVPDGALHLVPFAALPVRGGRGEPADRFLVERNSTVVLPSASSLAFLRSRSARRSGAEGLLAMVADPVYRPDDERLSRTPDRTLTAVAPDLVRAANDVQLDLLERLPATEAEWREISRSLPPGQATLRLLDFDASAEAVRVGSLADFRIVHFAGHGLLDSVHPELSGLVLSLYDRNGQPTDGFLRLRELRRLRLDAELVVLSACRSGLGEELLAEGMVGLPYALFEAGASRVVASYWDVGDRATSELMGRFYRWHLGHGLPAAEALRRAQLSLLREEVWSDPVDWAGFTLHGDWR